MIDYKILHITDLHINDPTSPKEKLRAGFYKEFINGLHEVIKNNFGSDSIDSLLITGDFVDKGKVDNFSHAKLVVEYFSSKFNTKKIGMCIGNHDFNAKIEQSGNIKDSRKPYNDFAAEYSFGPEIKKGDFYTISHDSSSHVYLLAFDSIIGANGNNIPSILNDSQIDEIIHQISLIDSTKTLIVISHYPMYIFNRSTILTEEEGWVKKHLWTSGNKIFERCLNTRKEAATIWFFGDAHIPDFASINNHHIFMTGMIGGDYTSRAYIKNNNPISYNKTNEVKLIELKKGDNSPIIYTFTYKPTGFDYDPHTGQWEMAQSRTRDLPHQSFAKKNSNENKPLLDSTLNYQPKLSDSLTEQISSSIQTAIIEQIKLKKLYSFNRYATSNEESSLAWISIHRLFENKELLCGCISKSYEWLKKSYSEFNNSNCIFIGINFWGGILASQVSIETGIRNFCLATKSDGRHNNFFETIECTCETIKQLKEEESIKYIFFFTDVISTGKTIYDLKNEIGKSLNLSDQVTWVAISIISDKKQFRRFDLSSFNKIGTFCSDLRIPIISNDDLPEEHILPVKYDIR
jgi:hypothetical protein